MTYISMRCRSMEAVVKGVNRLVGTRQRQQGWHALLPIPVDNRLLMLRVQLCNTNPSSSSLLPAITTTTTPEKPGDRLPIGLYGPATPPRRHGNLATSGFGPPASPATTAAFPLGSEGDVRGGQVTPLPIRPAILGSEELEVGTGHVWQDCRDSAGVRHWLEGVYDRVNISTQQRTKEEGN